MTIKRTGNCFEAAAQVIIEKCLFPGKETGYILVHGLVIGEGPLEGVRYWHAWVETDDGQTVIDVANGWKYEGDAGYYYRHGQVGRTIRYTPEEVRKLLLKHEHYGPWEQELLDHVPELVPPITGKK